MADLVEHLVTTVARHFKQATVRATTVDLGFADLRIRCGIGAQRPWSGIETVQLLFAIEGGALRAPVELSMTGYAQSREDAVVEGGCGWTCTVGPVLRAAFAGGAVDKIGRFDVGSRQLFVDNFDRVLYFSPDGGEDTATARQRVGAMPYLAPRVLAGLETPPDRPSVVSVFVGEMPGRTLVEVKLDGVACGGFEHLVEGVAVPPLPQMALLREVGIVIPA